MDLPKIEVRFTGGVSPENVHVGELANVLKAIEDLFAAALITSDADVKEEDVLVGLVGVGSGSVRLQFATTFHGSTIAALMQIGRLIRAQQLLPHQAIGPIQTIHRFVRKHNCVAQFIAPSRGENPLAELLPTTELASSRHVIGGTTTLYGKVIRVGGKESEPRVWVQTGPGATVRCTASVDMARQLGGKLYLQVGLAGQAKWDAKSLAVQAFQIEEILLYEETPVHLAMARLRDAVGGEYDDIDDVPGYVSKLRQGEVPQ